MKAAFKLLLLVSIVAPVSLIGALKVSDQETDLRDEWVAANLQGESKSLPPEGYLMVYIKSGSVQKNGIDGIIAGVQGHYPLRIADKDYSRGLYCPSAGKIAVHLPGPGKSFDTVVGVDNNDKGFMSNMGRGREIASVRVDGKDAAHTPVMQEGMAGVSLNADLAGATDFVLQVEDAGGGGAFGMDWDQTDWADARVTLADGKVVWLGDLPIGPLRGPYTAEPPFSFRYGNRPSSALLGTWEVERSSRKLDDQRTEYDVTNTDPRTSLTVRCVAVVYRDFPTVEWTLYFKNNGSKDTPLLEMINPLDSRLERNGDREFVLHHFKGAPATQNDYEPYEATLAPGNEQHISAAGGRPSNSDLPYFNVEWPGQGVILAVGWPGQWAATFKRDEGGGLKVRAGQELTHFKLLPGEEVRTPLIVMQFYKGDWTRAQNLWRRWMIAHSLPRPDGKLPVPQVAANSTKAYIEMQEADEASQKMFIDRYLTEGIKLDYWWMDAGWYPFKTNWVDTGTWEPDPKRFPNGLRAVSDYAHSKGLKIVVWFEPERAMPGTWLAENHPEWLLKPPPNPGNQAYGPETRLFNFGNPEAWRWMTDHIDKFITDQGVDLYRQDFNMDPLYFWRANDAEDRQGITEIRYVSGLLAYWDALRQRHPGVPLDTCASGGRRIDLETLRRAVPLTRSDYLLEAVGEQVHTYGLASWVPYYGTEVDGLGPYAFRSQMCPSLMLRYDMRRKDLNYGEIGRLISQWREINKYYYGDYYPLTSYSTAPDAWLAWQFDRSDSGDGMVQAFRRPGSACEDAHLKLKGLDADARYRVTNIDAPGSSQELLGSKLLDHGLAVDIKNQPGAVIFLYSRVK
jgi:alpha-galactosidase